jgi:hypothetical protein
MQNGRIIVDGQRRANSSGLFDSMKHEKEREEKVGGVVTDTTFNGGGGGQR